MADYELCCCTTADLDRDYIERVGLHAVDFNYELDGVPMKDDLWQTMAPAQLYRRMLDGAEAKTSQVSVGEYLAFWEPMLDAGKDIVQVSLSSGISGTYVSACAAADQARERWPERRIWVVDSLCASGGYGMLAARMAQLRSEGMGASELVAWAEANRERVQHWFFSSDLTFFVRGGRISRAAGLIGGALNICPVMDVAPDGSLAVVDKVRTQRKAKRRVVERMRELSDGGDGYAGDVFMTHSDCLADAEALTAMIREAFPDVGDVRISDIGAAIGVHTGPGTVATFFWGKPGGRV